MLPLSIDLRKRVIDSIDESMSVIDTAKTFKISTKVIYNWLNLRKKTGTLAPKIGYQNGHSHKITDFDLFRTFAEQYYQCTSEQMAIEWEKFTQTKVSKNIIQRALKKIGYTYKKKLLIISNLTKRREINSWKK